MFSKEVYVARRKKLTELVSSGIILFPGNLEVSMNYPNNSYHFRQDSTFLYYFGLDTANLYACIDVDSGEEILFADELTIDDIIWMGFQPTFTEQAAQVGVSKVLPVKELKNYLEKATASQRSIHYLPLYQEKQILLLSQLWGKSIEELRSQSSVELIKAVVAMRSIKEDCEIAEIEKACEIGYQMHLSAYHNCRPGKTERELFGVIEGISYSLGARTSFLTILSQNGETLHNYDHSQILEEGRLLLIDAGAEAVSHYSSDFTRTIPVSGRFTPKQADVYNIVVKAQTKAIEMARPGITYKEVHLEVCRIIAEGMKALGIMKGNVEDAVASGAPALFMPHGLGHQMGLDVHDMEGLGENYVGYNDKIQRFPLFGYRNLRMGRQLETGMVLTVEPGIYFIPSLIDLWAANGTNKEFIDFGKLKEYVGMGGIRLEDDILITPEGCRILGEKRLPLTIEEVMNEMNR